LQEVVREQVSITHSRGKRSHLAPTFHLSGVVMIGSVAVSGITTQMLRSFGVTAKLGRDTIIPQRGEYPTCSTQLFV